jgi:hypothetical protein
MDAILGALVSARGRFWLTSAIPGAVAFWCLGALALGGIPLSAPRPARCAVPGAGLWCNLHDSASVRFAAIVLLGTLGVIAGTSLMAMLTGPVLSLLAGFGWPARGLLGQATRLRISAHRRRRARLLSQVARNGGVTARLAWYPTGDAALRPTRIGNAFSALDQRVRYRHGLDLPTCWQLIEQILPGAARDRLEAASRRVGGRIMNLMWTVAALVWLPAFPARLALLIAAVVVVLAALLNWAVCAAVEQYCALIEATVAANRRGMYTAVGWPLPASTAQEPEHGRALTGYLNRLSEAGDIPLEWPDEQAT